MKTFKSIFLWIGVTLSCFANHQSFAFQESLQSQDLGECHTEQTPVQWSYCIFRPLGSNPDLVYFFHGKGGSERFPGRPLPQLLAQEGFVSESGTSVTNGIRGLPTIVSISFGPIWLLTEKNMSQKSGLLEVFVDHIVPFIEHQLGGLKGRRLLLGVSMGGFNASQVVLKYPSLFERAALGCPAISRLSIYSPPDEIKKFVERTKADPKLVYESLKIAKEFFPDQASWESASPLSLAERDLGPQSPALHISCGEQDEYGFYEGAKEFADLAKEKGVKEVIWEPLFGGHCVFDIFSIGRFLTR